MCHMHFGRSEIKVQMRCDWKLQVVLTRLFGENSKANVLAPSTGLAVREMRRPPREAGLHSLGWRQEGGTAFAQTVCRLLAAPLFTVQEIFSAQCSQLLPRISASPEPAHVGLLC